MFFSLVFLCKRRANCPVYYNVWVMYRLQHILRITVEQVAKKHGRVTFIHINRLILCEQHTMIVDIPAYMEHESKRRG